MLVLIEGIDKAGKTTLANAVSQRTGYPVFRKAVPRSLRKAEFPAYFLGIGFGLAGLAHHLTTTVLVDRSFISDWVYSDGATIGWERWREWERYLNTQSHALLVYVRTSPAVIRARLQVDPDPYLAPSEIHVHLERYEDYLRRTDLRVLECSGEQDVEREAARVITCIGNAGGR